MSRFFSILLVAKICQTHGLARACLGPTRESLGAYLGVSQAHLGLACVCHIPGLFGASWGLGDASDIVRVPCEYVAEYDKW